MKIQAQIKKDPLEAMDALEKSLEAEPNNPQLNQTLREAALAANMPEIAAFALETILESSPKDVKILHELAKHHQQFGQPALAVEIYQRILQITPNDLAAVKGMKDASASASMQSGGWGKEETTYRDLIKNKEQAVALEQQSRVVRSEEMIENLSAELHAKVEAEPGNIDSSRRIAELYEQKEDWENAANWFAYAAALSNNSDTALVRKASDLQIRQFDIAIQAREDYIAANPGAPESEAYEAELPDLRKQRSDLALQFARTASNRIRPTSNSVSNLANSSPPASSGRTRFLSFKKLARTRMFGCAP
jgi:tetratricopeptide (TPR) repeat protein